MSRHGYLLAPLFLGLSSQAVAQTIPDVGPSVSFEQPIGETIPLDGGRDLLFIAAGRVPKVTLVATYAAPPAIDATDSGISRLAYYVLSRAITAPGADGSSFAERASRIGGTANIRMSRGLYTVSVETLADSLPDASLLLAQFLRDVDLTPSLLEEARRDMAAWADGRATSPGGIAADSVMGLLYPQWPEYGTPPSNAATRDHDLEKVSAYLNTIFRSDSSRYYLVGRPGVDWHDRVYDALRVERAASAASGVLPDPGSQTSCYMIVDREESTQVTWRVAGVLPSTSVKDGAALSAFADILGEGSSSRLVENLREDKGYAYAPRFVLEEAYGRRHWVAFADVQPDAGGASLEELFLEIDRLRTEAPSTDEIDKVRNIVFAKQMIDSTSRQGVMNAALDRFRAEIGYSGPPLSLEVLSRITPDDVSEAGRRLIRPEQAVIVILGDAKTVRAQLEGRSWFDSRSPCRPEETD